MRTIEWVAVFLASFVAGACSAQTERALGQVDSVAGILIVRPFVLDQPYPYSMTKEPFDVRSGNIVVLEVDRNLVRPREIGMPVLYAGSIPVETVNPGYVDGSVIGIVPSRVDLRSAPVYFGSSELPERVDAGRGEAELSAARATGIRPFPAQKIAAAMGKGGDTLRIANRELLYFALSNLIMTHAPADSDWAEGYRALPDR